MIRQLPTWSLSGAENMALDEALLNASEDTVLRLYTWQQATLSLGYFQKYHDVRESLPDPAMPIVRRITGGGAIYHADEVTYALVATLGTHGLPERTADCYPHLHRAIQGALADFGAPLQLAPSDVGDRTFQQEYRCFALPAVNDLVAAAPREDDAPAASSHVPAVAKVLGSAGRTHGQRVLIHGSLKIASNPWDGAAVAGCGLTAADAAVALQKGLHGALAGDIVDGDLTVDERAAWQHWQATRYAGDGWVINREGPRP